ncbi:MAG TPA: tetratricopeptide repeat protein [Pyrinomonadaceae bacterium]|jgi:predicted Zn-dependent protease
MNLEEVQVSDEELRVMLESGLVLREAGRLEEAEKIFLGVRELVPESDVPLVVLSSIAVRRRDFDEALRLCEEALQNKPDSLYARVNRAEILLYQKKSDEAEAELREIVENNADSPHRRTAESLLEVIRMNA